MESISEQVDKVKEAFNKLVNPQPEMSEMPEVEEVYPDHIIACVDGKYYKIKYKLGADGMPAFVAREQWVEVQETWKPAAKSIDTDVVSFGNAIKAVKLDDGSVKIGGYLVNYGDAKNTDLTGDFFAADTDFGDVTESDVYFNHRLPVEAGGKRIEYKNRMSRATLTKDEAGIFAEVILTSPRQSSFNDCLFVIIAGGQYYFRKYARFVFCQRCAAHSVFIFNAFPACLYW